MGNGTKTDNHNLAAKLTLRRHFLERFHQADPPHVLDCCQGSGVLWSVLRREFTIASYWGLDLKPKKGRLKLDSVRVLAQAGWPQDVIDVDTYGSPWKHWSALLPHVARPVTVFLTLGVVKMGGGGMVGTHALQAAGLVFRRLELPASFQGKLSDLFPRYCLGQAARSGLQIVEAREAVSDGNARYFGVHLRPAAPDRDPARDPA